MAFKKEPIFKTIFTNVYMKVCAVQECFISLSLTAAQEHCYKLAAHTTYREQENVKIKQEDCGSTTKYGTGENDTEVKGIGTHRHGEDKPTKANKNEIQEL